MAIISKKAATFRLPADSLSALKDFSERHNLSQAEIIVRSVIFFMDIAEKDPKLLEPYPYVSNWSVSNNISKDLEI